MNGIGNWFRQLSHKISDGFRRFMAGRYGTDRLNTVILVAGVIVCILPMFIRNPVLTLLFTLISYGLMFWAIFRMFSRNTYQRHKENSRFLMMIDNITDRNYKYFECPRCHQAVRVPRKKGKISITCPKCKEKFVRKT